MHVKCHIVHENVGTIADLQLVYADAHFLLIRLPMLHGLPLFRVRAGAGFFGNPGWQGGWG